MPLQSIMEVEAFDCWGIDFIGPFPSSYSYEYILLVVDYVTKWEEAIAVQHVDAKTAIHFLKKNIFSRFGTPRVLISDRGSHFCNAQLTKVLQHYSVKHKVASRYHPQINGQVEVFNKEFKKILEKTVAQSKKDWPLKLDEALWKTVAQLLLSIWSMENLVTYVLSWNKKLFLRVQAYENSKLYKQKVKIYHDKKLSKRNF